MIISKRDAIYFTLVLILIIIVLIFQTAFQNGRLKVLNTLKTPLLQTSKIVHFLKNLPGFVNLQEENKILKSENEALKLQLLKVREALLENQRLKALLDFKKDSFNKFLPALVIGRETVSWRASIIINRGRKDGVRQGSIVLRGEGLVGRITEVGPTISRATLITDPDFGVRAIIQRTREEAIVNGRDGGLIMKYLSLDADVRRGDLVITSGLGSVFTKGILIGEVLEAEKDPSGLFYNAFLKPAVDMERLEEVLIVK